MLRGWRRREGTLVPITRLKHHQESGRAGADYETNPTGQDVGQR